MDNKKDNIRWAEVFFGLSREQTKEEKIVAYKAVLIILIFLLGFLIIYPVDKIVLEMFVQNLFPGYAFLSGVAKLLLALYFWKFYGTGNKALAELIDELKKENPRVEEAPIIFSNDSLLGKNLGFKGFVLTIVLAIAIFFILFYFLA